MAATLFLMSDMAPAAAAGTTGAGMSFTMCADMSLTIVVSGVSRSG